MNRKLKRYRQASLFDCLQFSKRPRSNRTTMDESTSTRELSSAGAEKKESLPLENNICQAAYGSVKIKDENSGNNAGTSSFVIETDQTQSTDDSSFKNSADLFPETASLEDPSVPGSSHSEELFPDSENDISESHSTPEELNDSGDESDEPDYISLLNKSPDCSIPLPKLEPLENHTIMFSPHVRPGDAPRPYPSSYRDIWDANHVRMPCSPLNRYPVEYANGEKRIESRWDLICRSLKASIGSSKELEEAIMKYNNQYSGKWNFRGLHTFINRHWTEEERDHFFEIILPSMVEMTLNLPHICTQPVPLLKKAKDHYVTMSQKQIGCLLLNAFFCTFPRRTPPNRNSRLRLSYEYATFPDINFNRLYANSKNDISHRNAEKLKCLFNYFRRITCEEPTGTVTFHRQNCDIMPRWNNSTRGIRTAVIKSHGFIETDGQGMLQVDFANKFVGGGILGYGCVQEEIRFIICPELIVSRLFVESLSNNEVLIVTGVEQYSKYSGYADSFKWEGDFRDSTPRDSWGRRYSQLVAMDAFHFKIPSEQYKLQFIKRELNKAYCAFYENASPVNLPAVATGNWGCGAFKGNVSLKFLIQLMAASEAGRSLLYFTFGNKKLKKELQSMHDFLNDKNLTVGDVWRLLMSYSGNVSLNRLTNCANLYEYIYSQFVIKENSRQQNAGISNNLTDNDKRALLEDVAGDGSSTDTEDGT